MSLGKRGKTTKEKRSDGAESGRDEDATREDRRTREGRSGVEKEVSEKGQLEKGTERRREERDGSGETNEPKKRDERMPDVESNSLSELESDLIRRERE